jgi:DNA-binding transcriptional MerR regulator
MFAKQAKLHYSGAEAARELGISIDQLHALIRQHLVNGDEELANVPRATFQPSDLLLLRLLSRGNSIGVRE